MKRRIYKASGLRRESGYPRSGVKAMTNIGMERMRLQSHQQIRRFLQFHKQQHRSLSTHVARQRTCRFNANSAFLQCAVNPSGCCSDCQYYEPQDD